MQRPFLASLLIPVLMLLISCGTSKQLPYFKDLNDTAQVQLLPSEAYQPLHLQVDDQLQITISSATPEGSQFFNLISSTPVSTVQGLNPAMAAQSYMNVYSVGDRGFLTLPILGDIKAAGLTTDELKDSIIRRLIPRYLLDAVVSVRLTNFKVTVIGEVSRPVSIPVNGERINVLEALGMAGDMTVYGVRKNVKIIRKLPDGQTQVIKLDFNKKNTLSSAYFQLQQNDVVYVEPNKSKGLLSSNPSAWISVITSISSLLFIILSRT